MANEVHFIGTKKMGVFSDDEGICIYMYMYLFRYRFVKLETIIHVATSRDVLDSVIKQHGIIHECTQ